MFCELSVLESNPLEKKHFQVSTYLVPMRQYFAEVNRFGSRGPVRNRYSRPFVWDTSLKSI